MDVWDFPEGWNVENLCGQNRKLLMFKIFRRNIETAIVSGWRELVVENHQRDPELDEMVNSLKPRGFQIEKLGRGKLHGGYGWRITWKTIEVLRQEAEDAKRAIEERRRENIEIAASREKFIGYVGYEPSDQGSTAGDLAGNYPV